MNPGDYNCRVTIKSKTESKSGSGAVKYTESTVATVWAAVEPLQGRELWEAHQVHGQGMVRVRMRRTSQTSSITPKNWLVHQGQEYDIEFVPPAGTDNRREIELMCKLRVE